MGLQSRLWLLHENYYKYNLKVYDKSHNHSCHVYPDTQFTQGAGVSLTLSNFHLSFCLLAFGIFFSVLLFTFQFTSRNCKQIQKRRRRIRRRTDSNNLLHTLITSLNLFCKQHCLTLARKLWNSLFSTNPGQMTNK